MYGGLGTALYAANTLVNAYRALKGTGSSQSVGTRRIKRSKRFSRKRTFRRFNRSSRRSYGSYGKAKRSFRRLRRRGGIRKYLRPTRTNTSRITREYEFRMQVAMGAVPSEGVAYSVYIDGINAAAQIKQGDPIKGTVVAGATFPVFNSDFNAFTPLYEYFRLDKVETEVMQPPGGVGNSQVDAGFFMIAKYAGDPRVANLTTGAIALSPNAFERVATKKFQSRGPNLQNTSHKVVQPAKMRYFLPVASAAVGSTNPTLLGDWQTRPTKSVRCTNLRTSAEVNQALCGAYFPIVMWNHPGCQIANGLYYTLILRFTCSWYKIASTSQSVTLPIHSISNLDEVQIAAEVPTVGADAEAGID